VREAAVDFQVQDIGAVFATAPAGELRARAMTHGLAAFGEAEILALILSRSVGPRAGSSSLALLQRFGCLPRVYGATFNELLPVAGKAAALELRLMADVTRRVLEFEVRKRPLLTCWSAVRAYLRATLAGRSRECFRVLFLDKANQLIADELMGEGTVDHAPVYPREVMRRALELAASACCLVHNHPTGGATPSAADVDVTRQVVAAGRAVGVAVHDHFLVAGDQVVSFKGLGLM
jgi:DNA repair protein RadC